MTFMSKFRNIATAAVVTGVLMTMPGINSGGLDLPEAITEVPTSPTVARTGVVTAINEATSITVAVSGSNVLVEASYLFPQYLPMLGDIVYIAKQDAQWLVLGTMSGAINSEALNPSFELGDDATTPANWSFTVNTSVAGVPTFRKEFGLGIQGNHIGIFRNASAGVAGGSSGTAVSSLVPATEGQKWALGFYVTFAEPDLNASLEAQGGNIQITSTVQFFDEDSVIISGADTNFTPITSSFINPLYVRTFSLADGSPYVVAPAGTAFARARIFVAFTMHVNCASEVGIDYVLLRHQ